jgi:polyhydroxyalkanoate synthesis regulator phasin
MNPFECIKAAAYGALGAFVMLFCYEGIPGLARIPYMTSIPIIGEFAGWKHTYADEQVKIATKNMVDAGLLAVAEAKAEKFRVEAERNRKAAQEAVEQAQVDKLKRIESNERYDQTVAADSSDDGATVSQSDLDWLHNNGR